MNYFSSATTLSSNSANKASYSAINNTKGNEKSGNVLKNIGKVLNV